MTAPNQAFSQREKPQETMPYTPIHSQHKPRKIRIGATYKHKVVILSQKVYILGKLTNVFDVMSISLGKTFRENSRAVALAAALSVATPFAAVANDADSSNAPAPTATTTVSTSAIAASEWAQAMEAVKVRNSSQFRKEVVQTGTARASNDRIAVAIYGADEDMFKQTVLAVWQAQQEGIDVAGVIIGSMQEARGYDVYADGHRLAERTPEELVGNSDIRSSMYASIKYADSSLKLLQAEAAQEVAALSTVSLAQN